MNTKNKIIFFGTPDFAVPALEALIANGLKPILVVTQPDRPAGRAQRLTPPPVKSVAQKNNLSIAQPKTKKQLQEILTEYNFDLAVLVAYGMIIPSAILTKPQGGFLNLHPSLLPKYRGASPVQTALRNGEAETGVTIIKLNNQLDAGPIVAVRKIKIALDDNAETLHDRLAKAGAELLVEVIPEYLDGKIKPVVQPDSGVSYTKMIKREDGQVDWNHSAAQILNQWRALTPWPGIFTYLAGQRLKILNLSLLEAESDQPANQPGFLFLGPKKALTVKCGQGVVVLESVQPAGKKVMSGQEFLRGQKDLIGRILK